MVIHGMQKMTLVDFPGLVAAILFSGGCNFRCPFCQNAALVLHPDTEPRIPDEEIFGYLAKRRKMIEGVVLTGGEPTLQLLILDFMTKWVDEHPHALIQIETNATQPQFFLDTRFTNLYLKNYHKEIGFGNICVCASPKCNEVTKRYTALAPKVWPYINFLKFLVSADPQSPYYNNLPDYVDNALCDVYLSPITVYKNAPKGEVASIWDPDLIDHEATAKNYAYAAQCVLYPSLVGLHCPLKLSLQTHLFTAVA